MRVSSGIRVYFQKCTRVIRINQKVFQSSKQPTTFWEWPAKEIDGKPFMLVSVPGPHLPNLVSFLFRSVCDNVDKDLHISIYEHSTTDRWKSWSTWGQTPNFLRILAMPAVLLMDSPYTNPATYSEHISWHLLQKTRNGGSSLSNYRWHDMVKSRNSENKNLYEVQKVFYSMEFLKSWGDSGERGLKAGQSVQKKREVIYHHQQW